MGESVLQQVLRFGRKLRNSGFGGIRGTKRGKSGKNARGHQIVNFEAKQETTNSVKQFSPSFDHLATYVPEDSWPDLKQLLERFRLQVKIAKPRKTKIGDYRPSQNGQPHKISVNSDLNPYAFLITLIHEVAHLVTYEQYRHKVKPHGKEWKQNFQQLLNPFLKADVFPNTIEQAVKTYLSNPAAASCTDTNLARSLQQFDDPKPEHVILENLPESGLFLWRNGRIFQKANRLRKRYRCIEVKTNRYYLFSPVAEVKPVNDKK